MPSLLSARWLVGLITVQALSMLLVYRSLDVTTRAFVSSDSWHQEREAWIDADASSRTQQRPRWGASEEAGSLAGMSNAKVATNVTSSTAQSQSEQRQFALTAVAMFRVNFTSDLLKFTLAEIDQWMTYLEYAGVQHFYLYDNCQHDYECVADRYRNDSRVTYVHWPEPQYTKAQNPAYEHHRINHAKAKFELQLDIDEYPFMPNDSDPNFLRRYAFSMQADQTLIPSWFFGGPAETNHTWRAMRYFHKQPNIFKNGRHKPLYAPEKVSKVVVHQAQGPSLVTQMADPNTLYLKHYWCERIEQPEVYDDTIVPLMEKVIKWNEERKTEEKAAR